MSKISIVMYHYVRDIANSRYPNIKGLDLQLFKKQIDFFQQNYDIISAQELIEAVEGKRTLSDKSMLLTFDDGYIDHYLNVFPILNQKGIKGLFSVPAKILAENKVLDVNKIHFILASNKIENLVESLFKKLDYYRGNEFNIQDNKTLYNKLAVENRFDNKDIVFFKTLLQVELPEELRNIIVDELFKENVNLPEDVFRRELYMNIDQVKLMKKYGMSFAIHGYDHYWLGKLTVNEMKNDIKNALDYFNGIIDKNNWIMCYPYGSYNDSIIDYISNNGCKLGISTNFNIADTDIENRYTLSRLDTNDYPPKSNNYLKYE